MTREGVLFGDGVNIASRLQTIANAGHRAPRDQLSALAFQTNVGLAPRAALPAKSHLDPKATIYPINQRTVQPPSASMTCAQ
jgi:class 3 adenylate cyclase